MDGNSYKNNGRNVSELRNEFKEQLGGKHTNRIKQYLSAGRNDAEINIPAVHDEKPSKAEVKIRSMYQADIDYLEGRGRPMLDEPAIEFEQLEGERKELKSNYPQFLDAKMATAKEIKVTKLSDTERNYKASLQSIEERSRRIKIRWQDARKTFNAITDELGRKQPIIYLKSAKLEWSVLLSLGVCEIPLNYTVFANFLMPKIETYILSLLLVIAVPILSHYMGICLRQYEETRKYVTHGIVIVTSMLTLNIAVGILRSDYVLAIVGSSSGSMSAITFILLSDVLFLVGMIVSFLHHDKSQVLVEAYNSFEQAERKFKEELQPFINEDVKIKEIHLREMREADDAYIETKYELDNRKSNVDKKIREIVRAHDTILNFFKAQEKFVNSKYEQCLATYRNENDRSRTDYSQSVTWAEIEPLKFAFDKMKELHTNATIS